MSWVVVAGASGADPRPNLIRSALNASTSSSALVRSSNGP